MPSRAELEIGMSRRMEANELSVDARDRVLLGRLKELEEQRREQFPSFRTDFGVTFRNADLGRLAAPWYTSDGIMHVTDVLQSKGALKINLKNSYKVTVDGMPQNVYRIGATETNVNGDMSEKDWIRDPALIGKAKFELWKQDPVRYAEEGKDARKIIMSTMHKMSSPAQLARFDAIIASDDPEFKANYKNHPYIVIEPHQDDPKRLDADKPIDWRMKQDAWQMAGITALDALDAGLIKIDELKAGNKQFLASMAPFLGSINFTEAESSGSWEEQMARRTSVIAVETALLYRVSQLSDREEFGFLRGEKEQGDHNQMVDRLVNQGLTTLGQRLPFESPNYPQNDPRYRTADAALFYLLDYGIPQLLAGNSIKIKANNDQPMTVEAIEGMILEQLERLHDPESNGMLRYGADGDRMKDTYLSVNFNTDGIQDQIVDMKKRLKEDAGDGPIDLNKKAEWRQEIVPEGRPAAWLHPNAQVSSWAAKRYLETSNERYLTIMTNYLNRALASVTGEGEYNAILGADKKHHINDVDAFRITEAWTTIRAEDGDEFLVASPHSPLNWGVGEYSRMLGLARLALLRYENKFAAAHDETEIFVAEQTAA
jgi:hypothetical protein